MKISTTKYVSIALLNALLNGWLYFSVFGDHTSSFFIVALVIIGIVGLLVYLDKMSTKKEKVTKVIIYLIFSGVVPFIAVWGYLYFVFSNMV